MDISNEKSTSDNKSYISFANESVLYRFNVIQAVNTKKLRQNKPSNFNKDVIMVREEKLPIQVRLYSIYI